MLRGLLFVVLVFFVSLLLVTVVAAQDEPPVEPDVSLLLVTVVAAQDEPPVEPDVPLVPAPEVGEVRDAFATTLLTLLAGVMASPVTSAVVALVKRIPVPFIQNADGKVINLVVAAVLVALVWVSRLTGYEIQFETVWQAIVALAPILGIGVAAKSSTAYYNNVVKGVPILGTGRQPELVMADKEAYRRN